MDLYRASVRWRREGDFTAGAYGRGYDIVFDGLSVRGSAAAHNVKGPYAEDAAADPEELFVASISTCHMLWFLDLARRAGVVVESYEDEAEGELAQDREGRMAMTRITLRPKVVCDAGPQALERLHHDAHARCFIANSVKSEVVIEPR